MTLLALAVIVSHPVEADAQVFTSASAITSIAQESDGTLWVGTRGGVLRIDEKDRVSRFTRLQGLPSHEIQGVTLHRGKVVVETPLGWAFWNGEKWQKTAKVLDEKSLLKSPPPEGLYVSDTATWSGRTYAASYGSGLWVFDGDWAPFEPGIPNGFKNITAVSIGKRTAIGSNSGGLAVLDKESWKTYPVSDPPNMNVQAIKTVGDELMVATLDQGLWALKEGKWRSVPQRSGKTPRQVLPGKDGIWVRYATGAIESIDGASAVLPSDIPRKQATSVDRRDGESFISYWGGFSVLKEKEWTHYSKLSELQGVQTTAICGDAESVYIGTQGAGLFRLDRASGKLVHIDSGLKLGDDWVTCLARDSERVWIGSFVGGLAQLDKSGLKRIQGIEKENVTAIEPIGNRTFVGTRNGVFEVIDGKAVRAFASLPLDTEVQALFAEGEYLWIGTRTSLWRVRYS